MHPPTSEAIATSRPALGLAVICLGTIGAALDSAVNIALPSISAAFTVGISDVRWVVIAYVLTYSSLLLIFGKLGDLFGYRRIFRAGLIVSAAGFAACSLAPTFAILLGGRVLQGLGIALVLSCAPALATSLYDERERTRILGIYAAMSAAGAALGPVAGGMLVDHFGWSAVFWARAPLALLALILAIALPPPRQPQAQATRFDWLGALLLVAWLTALLLGFASLATAVPVALPIALTVGAVAAFLAFLWHESRHPEPIIRPSLFARLDFTALNIMSIAVNFSAFSIMLIVPYYLARSRGLDAATGGIVLALAALGTVCGSWLAGQTATRIGIHRLSILGIALSLAGLVAIGAVARDASLLAFSAAMLVQGLGVGIFQVAYADRVVATLPVSDRGVAGSLTMVTRTIGVVAGATAHAAVQRWGETAALAAGASAPSAFLSGFEATFQVAAAVVGAALLLALLRPTRT